VQEERPYYKNYLKGDTQATGAMPTTYAIQGACITLGLHPDDIIKTIQHYGIRNQPVHANFIRMIKKGEFHQVAYRLTLDRYQIPLFLSRLERGEQGILERLLDSMIDLWFDRDGVDASKHEM
jgi:hypothetical protein